MADVKVAAANAIAVFETFGLDSQGRAGSERRIAASIDQAQQLIPQAPTAQRRDAIAGHAISAIESIVVASFVGHLRTLTSRIDVLRAKAPPESMAETLFITSDQIQRIEVEAVRMSRTPAAQSISEQLISAFGSDCKQAKSTIATCEDALRTMRNWTGTRRDWVVTSIVTLVVSILLIPIIVVATSWWESHGHAVADSKTQPPPASVLRSQAQSH